MVNHLSETMLIKNGLKRMTSIDKKESEKCCHKCQIQNNIIMLNILDA
jgi:hypothetical protein